MRRAFEGAGTDAGGSGGMGSDEVLVEMPAGVRESLAQARRAALVSRSGYAVLLLVSMVASAFLALWLLVPHGTGPLLDMPTALRWLRPVVAALGAGTALVLFVAHARAAASVGRTPAPEQRLDACEQEFIDAAHAALAGCGVMMRERFASPLGIYRPSPTPVELEGSTAGQPVAVRLVRSPSGPGWAIAVRPGHPGPVPLH